jgi:quercetin dioxygenase-like cupin family protein
MIPNYKTVSMRDNIYQPGASTSGSSMDNDMVCHMLEGELTVDTGSGDNLYKKGDVWSCAKGMPERSKNTGSTVAIMRVIDLLPPIASPCTDFVHANCRRKP